MDVTGGGHADKGNPLSYLFLSVLRIGFFIILSSVFFFSDEGSGLWTRAYVVATLAVLAANSLLYHFVPNRKALLLVAVVDIAAATPYGFVFLGGDDPDLLFLGLVGFFVFMHLDSKPLNAAWFFYVPAVIAAQILLEHYLCGTVAVTMYIICSAFVAFSSLIGSLVRYYRQSRIRISRLYSELEQSHKQLRAYAQNAEELAASRERIRIARDIHDTVGHAMTALLVQLQAVRKLAEADPAKSREHFLHCEELARSALREIRMSVRAMREEGGHLPLSLALNKLISDFSESTGLSVAFEPMPDGPALPDMLQTILLRTVQESLTNVLKHSGATEASVVLREEEGRLRLTIRDNGTGRNVVVPGFGLLNMRERIEEHGGSAGWSSTEGGGFAVEVVLPLPSVGQMKEGSG